MIQNARATFDSDSTKRIPVKLFDFDHFSLRTRIILIAILPAALMVCVVVFYTYYSRLAEVREELSEHGQVVATALAASSEYGIVSGNLSDIERITKSLIQSDARIYQISILNSKKQETLHVSSTETRDAESRFLEMPIHRQLLAVDPFSDDGVPNISSLKYKSTQESGSQSNGQIIGYVRVTMSPTKAILKQEDRIYVQSILVLIFFSVSVLFALWLAHGWTEPMVVAIKALRAIRSGAYETRIEVTTGGEIGELQTTINEMSASFRQDRERLEQRVAERTESLNAALEAQSVSLRARSLMIANASHELRTPVNALRLLLDLAVMQGGDFNTFRWRVSAITSHMTQLVENLLLLDPDRPGDKHHGVIEDFDLGEELRATARLVHGSSAELCVDVNSCAGVWVNGDLLSLRCILINLLSNAFKFTVEGKVSLIAVAEVNDEEKTVQCKITVKDTGSGIPEQMQGQIFEAFVTAGAQSGMTGVGLGLAIAQQRARILGATLRLIWSRENEGSEFECLVPFDLALTPSTEGRINEEYEENLAALPEKRQKVLLAEDYPSTAESVLAVIRLLQHEVFHVGTYSALESALTFPMQTFDVAIIDNRLPGGSGLDIIKHCRANGLAKSTKLILMTADVTDEVLVAARQVCDDVITKPTSAYRFRQLLGTGQQDPLGDPQIDHRKSDDTKHIDPRQLIALRRSGVAQERLENMFRIFVDEANKLLKKIEIMYLGDVGLAAAEFRDVIHRAVGGCDMMGAVNLAGEFRVLQGFQNSGDASKQCGRIAEIFAATQIEIKTLLESLR
jgi:signal transduction histidine kinase/CheY-like chemotaxis protein